MTLSLIIATHNRAELLIKCLDSVNRTVSVPGLKVTVVVVDNNSTDDTRERIEGYRRTSTIEVQYLFVAKPGKSAALNECLSRTTADLVGLIDDDEQVEPHWFEVAYREFSADPALEYIGGPCVPNWEQAPGDWLPEAYRGAIGIVLRPDRAAFSAAFDGMLMGGNAVIRRSTLEKVLPYPEHLGKIGAKIRSGEDEVIYHRLLELGAKGAVVPDLIILHWIPASRLTKRYFRKWVFGRAISMGYQFRERRFAEPSLLGLPRYKFGAALRGLLSMFTRRSSEQRFTSQLSVIDLIGTFYGRHFGN